MPDQIGKSLTPMQADTVYDLVSLGYSPKRIAQVLGLNPEEARAFILEAKVSGTRLYEIMRSAQESSHVDRVVLKAAEGGDPDAIEAYQKICNRNHYYAIIEAIDDDEFPIGV